MDIIGYADRWSVVPGETLTLHVSCAWPARYEADVVRLRGGPTTRDSDAVDETHVDTVIDGVHEGGPQATDCGSYALLPADPRLFDPNGFAIELLVWPTMPSKPRQILAAQAWKAAGFVLGLVDGRAMLRLGDGTELRAAAPLLGRRWYRLRARCDVGGDELSLVVEAIDPRDGIAPWRATTRGGARYVPARGASMSFAARLDATTRISCDHFNGKLEAPRLASATGESIAAWSFSLDMSGDVMIDSGPNALHGRLVNLPTRAVTGANWRAEGVHWRDAPWTYDAAHFHEDDLYDAGWLPSFTWTVPDDFQSGVYAVRLRLGDAEDRVPVFVRPKPGQATAPVAVLLPTATYMAYSNDHQAFDKPHPERSIGRPIVLQPADLLLHRHRELGLSLYDRHADGSGVCHSSRLRPTLTQRPKYRRWDGADGVGLRWFGLDLLLIGWLEQLGQAYDVVTDEDLDRDGEALLAPYRVVLTGNQPEYVSTRMLDALQGYVGTGGRLMYLGGNGFYWRIAFHPTRPGVIELRRGHDGAGPWLSEPGEAHHAFTGEPGGTWRTLGRPPQALVGVGFVVKGFTRSGPYERVPLREARRWSFVFAGIEGRRIGAQGLSGGGAAGIEMDRTDPELGTPSDAIVLARAQLPSIHYQGCILEELAGNGLPLCGEMVIFARPGAGGVFATGSIAWIGALPCDDFCNDVATVTANVLRRFLDSAPL